MELGVDGLVDDAHPAAPEHPSQHVPADPIGRALVVERDGLHDADERPALVARVEMPRELGDLVLRELAIDEGLKAGFGGTGHGFRNIKA